MREPKRIVCYAINGSGMGHLTRLLAVARWLRRYVALLDQHPPEVFFLTSSDASDLLADARFAAFKIPSKKVAVQSELNKLEYKRQAKHFVWNTLGVFSPDLLVVDTFPSGSFDELFQVLDGPFKKCFILRNVKPEYANRATFRAALGMYDKVVSPHRSGNSIVPKTLAVECDCTGEVVQFERDELLPKLEARDRLGVAKNRRLIYLSAGGGGDPDAQSTLHILVNSLRHEDDLHLLVGAGPLYRGQRLAGPHVTWFDSPAVWKFFGAVDAAISAGGYNSFYELLYARVPSLFFSQVKIADDQAGRIAEGVRLGVCRKLSNVADPELVRTELQAILDDQVALRLRLASSDWLPDNGARRCALELLGPLYSAQQLDWAHRLLSPAVAHGLERISEGATAVFAEWLIPLMPPTQASAIKPHHGFESILSRLSPAAAQEVETLLAIEDDSSTACHFEKSLLELLDTVFHVKTTELSRQALASETLKTLLAALNKQPLVAARNGHRSRWICDVVNSVRALLELSVPGHSVVDLLRLFRMFPRITEVDSAEAFALFESFLRRRAVMGDPPHAILQQLQVIKLSHATVTRCMMESFREGVST